MAVETKAVKFALLPLTNKKKNVLMQMATEFQRIYNFASERLPSFQTVMQSKSRSACENIRKDLKSSLHSQIVQEAIEYARANHETLRTANGTNNPMLEKNIIRIHNQAWDFKQKQNNNLNTNADMDTYYVVFPTLKKSKNRYNYIWLPVKISNYYKGIITSNEFGVGQIDINNETFITTYGCEIGIESIDYIPETYIGIDLGLNNLATLVVLNKDKKVLKVKFWDGRETRHIRNRFNDYRAEISEIGRVDLLRKNKGYESNWMHNLNHNISREIIEIAKKYPKPIIKLENLHKFTNLRWNFYQLREMIIYKAKLSEILTTTIPPKNTSIMCNKCGYTYKKNREGIHFNCLKCGYQANADYNASVNIGTI